MKTFNIYLRYWFIRLLYLLLFAVMIFGAYFYTLPQIIIGNYTLVNSMYSNVEHLPNWLYDVDYFIFIFAVATIILLVLIIFYNDKKRRKVKADKRFLTKFVPELFKYLFSENEWSGEEKKRRMKALKKELRSEHTKRLFIFTINDIHAQTVGLVKSKTDNILKLTKLEYLIKAYLHSPYIRQKLFALKIISEFGLEGYDKYILKLTKQRNNVLHAEALVTLLRTNVYNNLQFLVDLDLKLTLWDVNLIVKTVEELNIRNINYKSIINSSVPEVSVLGLILTRLHNRQELKNEVQLKIGYSNELVNEEAFLTFITFADNSSDFEFLMDKFSGAPKKAQILIIQSISKYENTEKTIQFLNRVVLNFPFTHKIEAIRQLLELDVNVVLEYKKSDDLLIRQSCLQVLDINLQ